MFQKEDVLRVIQGLKGGSYSAIMGIFPEEPTIILDEHLEALINSGHIIKFKGLYYPIVRSICRIPKRNSEASDDILLDNLSVEEIEKVFTAKEDDPMFFSGGYLIDETKTALFERYNNVIFDFHNFDYYLLSEFDNSYSK